MIFRTNQELAAEKAKTEGLLYNVLPQEIATRLRDGEAAAGLLGAAVPGRSLDALGVGSPAPGHGGRVFDVWIYEKEA